MKKICLFLCVVFILGALSGCAGHSHDFEYYLAKSATCSEEGMLEGICVECGEKKQITIAKNDNHSYTWIEIQEPTCTASGFANGYCIICREEITINHKKLNHDYVDDVCKRCNKRWGETTIPAGTKVGVTLTQIFNEISKYVYENVSMSIFEEFEITSVKANDKGLDFCFDSAGKSYSFVFELEKTSLEVEEGNTDTIRTFIVEYVDRVGYVLSVVYIDGTKKDVGVLSSVYSPETSLKKILSLVVNKNNEFVVVFEGNIAVNMGIFSISTIEIGENLFVYEKVEGKEEYRIVELLSKNQKVITIPETHRGLPVTEIGRTVFVSNNDIESVVLSKNLKKISFGAFWGCANLTSVVMHSALQEIERSAFHNSGLKTIFYYGTAEQRQNIDIHPEYNEKITNANWIYAN